MSEFLSEFMNKFIGIYVITNHVDFPVQSEQLLAYILLLLFTFPLRLTFIILVVNDCHFSWVKNEECNNEISQYIFVLNKESIEILIMGN